MLAAATGVAEFEIEDAEAKRMADAAKRVADLYDTVVSEKTLAWSNLGAAAAMVYGTRIFAYRARRTAENAERKRPTAPRVVQPMQGMMGMAG